MNGKRHFVFWIFYLVLGNFGTYWIAICIVTSPHKVINCCAVVTAYGSPFFEVCPTQQFLACLYFLFKGVPRSKRPHSRSVIFGDVFKLMLAARSRHEILQAVAKSTR
jgi:hypothetical protein